MTRNVVKTASASASMGGGASAGAMDLDFPLVAEAKFLSDNV